MPDHDFRQLVRGSPGIGRVLEAFGLENVGRNYYTARKRINEMALDTTHFDPLVRTKIADRNFDLDAVLIEKSDYNTRSLKRRLLSVGLIKNECAVCGLGPFWNGAPLTLRLDHANGDRHGARLSNLRMLCPNCDAQQPTFCGRNKRKRP